MPFINQKELIDKPQKKYVFVLGDQTVVTGTEWGAMKKVRKIGKSVVDVVRTFSSEKDRVTSLTKLIESKEHKPTNNE